MTPREQTIQCDALDYVMSLPDPQFKGSNRKFTEADMCRAYVDGALSVESKYLEKLSRYNWDGACWILRPEHFNDK